MQKFKETGDGRYIYHDEIDKACFQHDMAYGDSKDLTRKTDFYKILRDKAFNIATNLKYDGYQRGLASMVDIFFDKKASATRLNKFAGSVIKNEDMLDQQLAGELHKQIIKIQEKKSTSTFYTQYLGS